PFLIKTAEQLAGFAKAVNDGNIHKYGDIRTPRDDPSIANIAFVRLLTDIDLNNIEWEPIGSDSQDDYIFSNGTMNTVAFGGLFDGNGHVVKNLKIQKDLQNVGFFGRTMDAHILNLSIENAFISGGWTTGILVGNHWGVVNNCHVNGILEGQRKIAGGLIGRVYCSSMTGREYTSSVIKNSSSHVTIKVPDLYKGAETGLFNEFSQFTGGIVGYVREFSYFYNCFSYYNIKGSGTIGGFAGYASASLPSPRSRVIFSRCYAKGALEGNDVTGGFIGTLEQHSHIMDSFSSSDVFGGRICGGFAGINRGVIASSLSSGNITGPKTVGGFIGKNIHDIDYYLNNLAFWEKPDVIRDIESGNMKIEDIEMGKVISCSWFQDNRHNIRLSGLGDGTPINPENGLRVFQNIKNFEEAELLENAILDGRKFRASKYIYAKPNETKRLLLDTGADVSTITRILRDKPKDTLILFHENEIAIFIGDSIIGEQEMTITYKNKNDELQKSEFILFVNP
ncbi:MAG: hypothetical protein LBL05_08740, partial [Synergistaceae bacterium]|nr:hypothetical protein [Synergistaceae bacterium]